jgi:GNAT superfamily N-acetyltransferase
MEMYADYLSEIGIKKMYHNDKGFAIYGISGADCYLEELYVKPEHRGTSAATELADSIVKIAKDSGCVRLLGSVIPTFPASTTNMKIFLHYGMKVESCSLNFILLSKGI